MKQKKRDIDIIDFSVGMPFYVKDTDAFKKFDACNKSLNKYIHYFRRYEDYRDRVREYQKPKKKKDENYGMFSSRNQ